MKLKLKFWERPVDKPADPKKEKAFDKWKKRHAKP